QPARHLHALGQRRVSGSKSRFDTMLAAHLYGQWGPDEEIGSSSEGIGWAGMWSDMGVILEEGVDGSVTTRLCSDDDVAMVWHDTQKRLDTVGHVGEEDYVIEVLSDVWQVHQL